MKKIITYNIVQKVKVRKYDVETIKLCNLLRQAKKNKTLNNLQIAEKLNVSKTMVEHWFRKDKYFSIPEPELWFDIKKLLCIDTDYFDKQIMEFIIKDNIFEKGNRVYDENGISPAIIVSDEVKVVVWK